MYVYISLFISVDFIFITTSSFRGGRQQLIYLLFVNLSSLLLPRVHIQVKFLQCTFFCTVCVVLKQRFWRGSQCRRHIYFLANENKVSNFQNTCFPVGLWKDTFQFCVCWRSTLGNPIPRGLVFNREKLKMASTLTKVHLSFVGKNMKVLDQASNR